MSLLKAKLISNVKSVYIVYAMDILKSLDLCLIIGETSSGYRYRLSIPCTTIKMGRVQGTDRDLHNQNFVVGCFFGASPLQNRGQQRRFLCIPIGGTPLLIISF